MLRRVKSLLSSVFCLYLISFTLTAQADPASSELTRLLGNVKTMQAGFVQTIVDNKGKTLNQARGQMFLMRPGKFRWQVTSPASQLIVTNGKQLWIYDPDLEQVTIRILTREAGEAPALLLSDSFVSLEKDFHVQQSADSSLQWFELIPKDKGSMFDKIKLGFNRNQIQQMQLQDRLGHITLIRFSRVTTNGALSSSLFTFKIPRHVDVIDETKR